MILVLLFLYLVASLTSFLWIKRDKESCASVIVVLSGVNKLHTINRIKKAAELFNKNYAKTILISGKYLVDWMVSELNKLGVPNDRIRVQNKSTNTFEDAAHSFEFLGKIESILLVTASAHQRRASREFKRIFENIKIINTPSNDYVHIFSFFLPTGWLITLSEMVKFLRYA